MGLIVPEWPAPANVRAVFTTRENGFSSGVYQGLNLGALVGDAQESVEKNRRQLQQQLGLTNPPLWLTQVHGTDIFQAEESLSVPPVADGAVSHTRELALTVMTADCLPVLFCNKAGTVIATAHAGWRGLCAGILEKTIEAMQVAPDELLAWIGPTIGPTAFEVGNEVKTAFVDYAAEAEQAFKPQGEKWLANLFMLARQRLQAAGVTAIYGGDLCTFSDPQRFYSYRRDGQTGRMAGLIWLTIKS